MASQAFISNVIIIAFIDGLLHFRFVPNIQYNLLFINVLDDQTAMLVPEFLQSFVGQTYIDFGFLFYGYIIMLVIFCTNAINIVAGINGIEVGQSLVIAASVATFNLIQVCLDLVI